MEESTVSVIIPCYNYSKYIVEAIDSVLNQTHKPDEIIIVDDCSTDNSIEVIQNYLTPIATGNIKFLLLVSEKNRGLAASRNFGIKCAKSKYIMSFDADDIMRPDCIKEHLALADEKSIVTLGLMAFGSESYTARPKRATVEILLKTNCIYSNSLFPKKMWQEIGGFDESETMRLGWEDREFWLRALGAGYESKIGDYIALLWRRHPQTMSSTTADPNHQILQDYIFNKNKHILA